MIAAALLSRFTVFKSHSPKSWLALSRFWNENGQQFSDPRIVTGSRGGSGWTGLSSNEMRRKPEDREVLRRKCVSRGVPTWVEEYYQITELNSNPCKVVVGYWFNTGRCCKVWSFYREETHEESYIIIYIWRIILEGQVSYLKTLDGWANVRSPNPKITEKGTIQVLCNAIGVGGCVDQCRAALWRCVVQHVEDSVIFWHSKISSGVLKRPIPKSDSRSRDSSWPNRTPLSAKGRPSRLPTFTNAVQPVQRTYCETCPGEMGRWYWDRG